MRESGPRTQLDSPCNQGKDRLSCKHTHTHIWQEKMQNSLFRERPAARDRSSWYTRIVSYTLSLLLYPPFCMTGNSLPIGHETHTTTEDKERRRQATKTGHTQHKKQGIHVTTIRRKTTPKWKSLHVWCGPDDFGHQQHPTLPSLHSWHE